MLDYLYISDAKVDKLLLNMPSVLKGRYAMEFKVDLKVFGITVKPAAQAPDDLERRKQRLDAALKYIHEGKLVGTIDNPAPYIEDTLPMNYTPYTRGESSLSSTFVYFGGSTQKTIVGLGGSVKHLLGHSTVSSPAQSVPAFLMHHLTGTNPPLEELLASVVEATGQMESLIKHPMRFMAKQVASSTHEGRRVLLASPLYVAEFA